MPVRTSESPQSVVSVCEMARLCQLSRSRFYELIGSSIMPAPVYDVRTRRPMFTTELQAECLRVRSSNIGINGQFIMFYARRTDATTAPARRTRSTAAPVRASNEGMGELVDALRSL